MVGGGSETTEVLRGRVVRGRPNWWVILAVSLALMALLVATAGSTPHGVPRGRTLASAADTGRETHRVTPSAGGTRTPAPAAPTTTTTTVHAGSAAPAVGGPGPSSLSSQLLGADVHTPPTTAPTTAPAAPTSTTTTTTTTTTVANSSQPADRTQTEGYLDPPLQTSNGYRFNGSGAMQISVVWSGSTYLTMTVSCPGGSQSVGGTTAMQASLPDASGSCLATVSEPSSETTVLTYSITIGPAGG